jgi:YHS domain-containing protein
MKILNLILSIALLAINGQGYAQTERPIDKYNLNKSGLSIKGYDPVSYHLGEPQKGLKSLSYSYNGVRYLFGTQENRSLFEKNPSAYEPVYGGWCTWAMLKGDKVDIHPKRYKIINGKTYLFYDALFGNTLKKWNRLTLQESETEMIKRADAHWRRTKN